MSSEQFNAREDAYWAAYSTNDIRGAESALFDGLKAIDAYEKNYTIEGTDFDFHRAMFHGRLFLIYQATHETNKMVSELRRCIELMNKSNESQHTPPLNMTEDGFAAKLKNVDRGKDIRWKNEILDKIESQKDVSRSQE